MVAIRDHGAWRGRVVFEPAGGAKEIIDCREQDKSIALAEARAELLAAAYFPQVWNRRNGGGSKIA